MTRRYKVWAFVDGKLGALLLRTGSTEQLSCDVGGFEGSPLDVAKFACERTGYNGPVAVKDFDAGCWFKVDPSSGLSVAIAGPSQERGRSWRLS